MDNHAGTPQAKISVEDCNDLERRHYELTGIKEMMQDKSLIAVADNKVLADRLIDRYVDAYTAYNAAWMNISHKYFVPPYINAQKACDFSTRIVTLVEGD